MNRLFTLLACAGVAMLSPTAEAGFFKTISIDSDFSDWADVPVVDSDAADNAGFVDIATTKIAHDNDFLYIYNSFHTAKSLGTFIALDVDSDTATGFDIFTLGLIGSEAAWQNDFPFTQATGVYNNGVGMSGNFFGTGAADLDAFADSTERELAISLDIVFNGGGGDVFDDDDFDILFWTDQGPGDVSAPISYSLAPVPEPTSAVLALLGSCLIACKRRR